MAHTRTLCVLAIALVNRVWASLLSVRLTSCAVRSRSGMFPISIVTGRSRSTCDRTVCPPGRPAPQRPSHPPPWPPCKKPRSSAQRPPPPGALQLLPDLGLRPPGDLPPDPRTVRTPAERDGADPGAVRRISVDRTFAVPTARSSRHMPDSTPSLALGLALLRGLQDHIWPLTCGAKGTRTPGLLDANYRRGPARGQMVQLGTCADDCSGWP
jgi:hypothetical protein